MLDFHGQTAVVTGAAKGIGFAIASMFAELGAHVALVDVDEDGLASAEQTLTAAGRSVGVFCGDVLSAPFLASVVEQTIARWQHIDVWVNNAGVIRDNFLNKISEDDWDRVIDVNLKGPFMCCQAIVPHMRERSHGKIINIISRAWLGNIGQSNYSASKGGLVSLTRTLALELARFQIHVNGVAPGLIDTPMTQGMPEKSRERLIQMQPTKQMGKVTDIAAAVCFLASSHADFITGQILHVDGGKSCGLLSL